MTDTLTKSKLPVTVVGLGAMGHALASTLLDAGHPTTVWNRSPGRADDLVARGATVAADLAGAITAGELVIVCVLDNAVVRDLLEPARLELAGRTLVNLTTGTPGEAGELAEWAAANGADYLDGVIMAVPAMIGKPEAMLLYGGSRSAYETHAPTLARLAPNSPFLGVAELPAVYDVGMLSLMYATLTGWLQAFAVVGSAGVSATAFLPYLQQWFTNVVVPVDAAEMAEHVDRGVYPDTMHSSLALNDAGLELLVRAHREAGVDATMLETIGAFAARRVAEGCGADGYTSLIEAIRHPPAA